MLTGQECERSRRQQALHFGHSGIRVDSQAAVLPQAFKDRVHARQLAGVVQESGAPHRRLSTPPASSDFFCVPFGVRANGARLYTSTDSPLQRRRPRRSPGAVRRVRRLRRLRPALPASSPMCAETCNWASDADCDDGGPSSGSARPGPTACGTGPSSHVVTKVTVVCT